MLVDAEAHGAVYLLINFPVNLNMLPKQNLLIENTLIILKLYS